MIVQYILPWSIFPEGTEDIKSKQVITMLDGFIPDKKDLIVFNDPPEVIGADTHFAVYGLDFRIKSRRITPNEKIELFLEVIE